MKPLCCDGDAPQFAVRRDEGWTDEDARRLQRGIWNGVLCGSLCWALIVLGLAWLGGCVP